MRLFLPETKKILHNNINGLQKNKSESASAYNCFLDLF